MTAAAASAPRAIHVAQLIESDGPGGAERMLVQLAAALAGAGHRVTALLLPPAEGWLEAELARAGIPAEHLPLDAPRVSRGFAVRLADALTRLRVDVVHAHEFTMAFYGAWAARRAGIPAVITMHGGRYYAEHLRRRVALRLAADRAAAFVAVSHPLARGLARDLWIAPSRVVTIPNGVPCARAARSALRDELGLDAGDRLVVSVGNLYAVKGHDVLLDAVARLRTRYPRLHLAIAGRGPRAAALARHARDLGIDARVHMLGLRADVPEILAAADVFALPSRSEGLPLALLEAMCAGCPIVATAVGDVPAVLRDGVAGRVVPPESPERLADAMDEILASPGLARELGRRAAAHAEREYGIDAMLARYASVYDRALSG